MLSHSGTDSRQLWDHKNTIEDDTCCWIKTAHTTWDDQSKVKVCNISWYVKCMQKAHIMWSITWDQTQRCVKKKIKKFFIGSFFKIQLAKNNFHHHSFISSQKNSRSYWQLNQRPGLRMQTELDYLYGCKHLSQY